LQSTTAASTTSTQPATTSNGGPSTRTKNARIRAVKPRLDKLVGREGEPSPSMLHLDLKRLNSELHRGHELRRRLRQTLKGPMAVRTEVAALMPENANVHVENSKIVVGNKTIPNIWLRDNCQCSSCMHESTKQRLQDTFAIPKDLSIKSASVTTEEKTRGRTVDVEWNDGHKSRYTQPFLANATTGFERRSTARQGLISSKLWDKSIAKNPPKVPYQEATDKNMSTVLNAIVSNAVSLQFDPQANSKPA